jgi:CheY-like chemotaxis protein
MAQASPWIAIVDDDPSVLKGLARLLRARAFEVKTYTSARDFLAALPEGLPECLIVDLQMPEMPVEASVITRSRSDSDHRHYRPQRGRCANSTDPAAPRLHLSKPLRMRLFRAIDDA